jgi:hypothetical protein
MGAFLLRAVRTAEDVPLALDTMPDHMTSAVLAPRCHRLDRALEAVKVPDLPLMRISMGRA